MIKNIRNFFRSFRKKKKYKNYFLKDNLKDEIKANLAEVGKWSYGRPNIYRWDWKSKIIIGNFCSLGPDIKFYIGGNHRSDWISTSPLPASQFSETFKKAQLIKNFSDSRGDIIIGHDVWIGGSTTILSGVTIGTGSIIAAGSVVVNDVDPYTVSGGNPNREIKKRFEENIVKRILQTEWWLMEDSQIDDLSKYLLSSDTEKFFSSVREIKENK